ncbi:hypothetical protein BBJ29_005779 [Phytophthora kernoviae]|uniref:Calponin-homology (CH) domain-containing protein n=1 Tax=Phytophthora kernoviae TaxID=325452 RepID=A0A3F2RX08_9STRA|nr:hypothetical protein BBJ29_005779 [Phytophthora kernoviae]RLN65913.1 hypothetical protein BBP00_00002540 [Phytophthora kernoviae]
MLRWLNEEMKLHRKVEVLERDLSNGYIFAEVLHLKGLEPQFENYEDTSSTAVKIRNMELLEQRFGALGVPFSMSTRRAIMMEDRSVVLQFLLQLKDFLRPRPKGTVNNGKTKVKVPEQSVKARVAAESKVPPRDVEERFGASMMQKFHPTEIRFDKGFDMAVHLRKFEQAQWTAENKLNDLDHQTRTTKNGESAAGYTAARTHLNEKAQFMRDWDQEHREKWKDTQVSSVNV